MKKFFFLLLSVATVIAAEAQFSNAYKAGGSNTPAIKEIRYSTTLQKVTVAGDFNSLTTSPPNGQTQALNNFATVDDKGGVSTINYTFPEMTVSTCDYDGALWIATTHNLYKYASTTGIEQQSFSVTNGKLLKIAVSGNTLLAIGTFTDVSGVACNGAVNFHPENGLIDTIGLGEGLPSFPQNLDWKVNTATIGSTVYFNWLDGQLMGRGVWQYENGVLSPVPGAPNLSYATAITTMGSTLYLEGEDASVNHRVFTMTNCVWDANPLLTLNGGTASMAMYSNKLYISGSFSQINFNPTSNNIIWDNGSYTSFSVENGSSIADMVFFPNGIGFGYMGINIFTTLAQPTSISDPTITAPIIIYPNPATNFIRVAGRTPVTITNLVGEKVYEGESEGGIIDVSNYPAGMYIANGTTKFLIQH